MTYVIGVIEEAIIDLFLILSKQSIIFKVFTFILVGVLVLGFAFTPVVEAATNESQDSKLQWVIAFVPTNIVAETKESQDKKVKQVNSK